MNVMIKYAFVGVITVLFDNILYQYLRKSFGTHVEGLCKKKFLYR
jgi:hypothetical protein